MSKNQYSDDDKAFALAALDSNQGNVLGTANALQMPRKTLEEWSKGRNQHPVVAELRQIKRGDLAQKFVDLAHLIVDAAPDKIDKAGLKDALIAAGTAVDKAQLLLGKPTSISEDVTPTADQLAEIRRIKAERAERESVSDNN